MFALKSAPKSRPTPPDVILSLASRDFLLPEIAPLRFLGGTRSRRISPRFHLTSKASTAHFLAKPVAICTYTFRESNAFKISTYKISRLKTVQNQHLRKTFAREAIPVRRNVQTAARSVPRRDREACSLATPKFGSHKNEGSCTARPKHF